MSRCFLKRLMVFFVKLNHLATCREKCLQSCATGKGITINSEFFNWLFLRSKFKFVKSVNASRKSQYKDVYLFVRRTIEILQRAHIFFGNW